MANSSDLWVTEDPDLVVLCPHCENPLTTISSRTLPASGSGVFTFGKRYVYACPNCRKCLGVSQRKGFWMG